MTYHILIIFLIIIYTHTHRHSNEIKFAKNANSFLRGFKERKRQNGKKIYSLSKKETLRAMHRGNFIGSHK